MKDLQKGYKLPQKLLVRKHFPSPKINFQLSLKTHSQKTNSIHKSPWLAFRSYKVEQELVKETEQ